MNKKHPKALPYLFLSEMWERFGFYLMLGIFFLYMTDTQRGGMAMDRKEASDIFGTFIALVYLTPFVGGLIADRVLGYRISITLGGILMGIGYCGLAIPGMTAFYVSLLLIIIGNGFFKPNISTILGNVYNDPEYKPLKDSGYNIFYMGINIGAFICNFFGSYLRNNFSWGAAFAAAGIGMFIGVIIFWIGNKHYAHADVRKAVKPEDMPVSKILGITLLPALIAGYIGWIIPDNIFGSDSTDAFILGALPVAGYYVNILLRSDKEDRRPLAALLAVFAVAIVFWAVFKQNGTALTTWAESYTNREVPQSVEPVAKVLGVTQTVTFSKDSVPLTDSQFRVARDENKKAIKTWDYPLYYKNIPAPHRGCWQRLRRKFAPTLSAPKAGGQEMPEAIHTFSRLVSCLALLIGGGIVSLAALIFGWQCLMWLMNGEWPSLPIRIFWYPHVSWIGVQVILDWIFALPTALVLFTIGVLVFKLLGMFSDWLYQQEAHSAGLVTTPSQIQR